MFKLVAAASNLIHHINDENALKEMIWTLLCHEYSFWLFIFEEFRFWSAKLKKDLYGISSVYKIEDVSQTLGHMHKDHDYTIHVLSIIASIVI